MKLTARQVAVLEVLAKEGDEQKRGMYAGRVGVLAGFKPSGRIDAGTTKTLDSLNRQGFVHGVYGMKGGDGTFTLDFSDTGRKWWITDEGRRALAHFAFGE